jgi:hypothetical protein
MKESDRYIASDVLTLLRSLLLIEGFILQSILV